MIAFECEDYSSITALIKKSNLSSEVEKLNASEKEKKSQSLLPFLKWEGKKHHFPFEKTEFFFTNQKAIWGEDS